MFGQLSVVILSILILFIFTFTSVSGAACSYYEKSCYSFSNNWCCPSNTVCGYSYGVCDPYTTTHSSSSDLSSGVLVALIFVPILICFMCLSCCCHKQQQQQQRQRLHPTGTISNHQRVIQPYQQQSTRRPIRVVHVRPVYNVSAASPISSIYEAPPPSYEDAIANQSPKYQSISPSPPMTATVDQANLQV